MQQSAYFVISEDLGTRITISIRKVLLPPIKREAALFADAHLPIRQKLPCTATAVRKREKFSLPNTAVAVQGSSGR